MTATPTPLSAGTDVGETLGGKLIGRSTLHDSSGADAMGVVGPTPSSNTLLGRLKAIADVLAGGLSVTGAFFPATQPVSAAALPLPAGAATSAKQDALVSATAVTGPPFTITAHATNPLERPIIGLAVKTAGTIIFRHPNDSSDRTIDVPVGFFPMGGVTHIRTGGTATGLTGF